MVKFRTLIKNDCESRRVRSSDESMFMHFPQGKQLRVGGWGVGGGGGALGLLSSSSKPNAESGQGSH